jgi:hypothetical protein
MSKAGIKAGLPMRNYYKILGVAGNAKDREVKHRIISKYK